MKRAFIFIIAVLFLISSTELHQLLRLPLLLRHYRLHRQADPSLSPMAFLKLHYNGHHQTAKADKEDSQLPFKSVVFASHTDNLMVIKVKREMPARPLMYIRTSETVYFPGDIPDRRADAIFHPPQAS